jgi:apolipoprotein N-acyltransferase
VEAPYLFLLALHAAAGLFLAGSSGSRFSRSSGRVFLVMRASEILFALAAVLFLFSFIYATNANMDYVQRFMTSHGNLRLAPNSAVERWTACVRFLPLLLLDAAWYVGVRLGRISLARRLTARPGGARPGLGTWALPLTLLSAMAWALAFPSFVDAAGLPVLGFVCLVPVLLGLGSLTYGWGIFYGTLAGVLQTMVSSYWLGTFDLLSLQFVSLVTAVQYVLFMAAALFVFHRAGAAGFLVFPAAWTLFDWLRSLGFLGYPWGMLGASQYSVLPLIQAASVTGVWGVTFLVTLCNTTLAWYVGGPRSRRVLPAVICAAAFAVALGWAGVRALQERAQAASSPGPTVRLALIQQDEDPRKDDYGHGFETLKRLTGQTLASHPDLVAWSETAFVPNIRRWSQEDPAVYPYAALVRDFLAWQKATRQWLITGNDDYSYAEKDGVQERLDYNGAVLFSPRGERLDTYHKIHLVPFTEYFPYKKQLPGVYKLLQSFDAYLWEPGDRRVVFQGPGFSFSTPICFEDVFPDDVRRFVLAGAQVLVNLSNDYWSLTDTEAMQHAANAVFRAVENGVPLARSSASGLTCLVLPNGRIAARAPFYEATSLVVDVPLRHSSPTPYTRWGDWFPAASALLLVLLLAVGRRPA